MTTIQLQPAYKPSFNGYIDRSVIRLVNRMTDNSVNNLIDTANKFSRKVEPHKLVELNDRRSAVLFGLEAFMRRLHPKTALKMNDSNIFFENTKTKTRVHIYDIINSGEVKHGYVDLKNPAERMKKSPHGFGNIIDFNELDSKDLVNMKTFSDELFRIDAKKIDNEMYIQFTDRISRQASDTSVSGLFRMWRNGRKAKKIAPEFGDNENWKTKLASIRKNAIEQMKINKSIEKANDKLKKDVFQGKLQN